jgi:hypothetical protein
VRGDWAAVVGRLVAELLRLEVLSPTDIVDGELVVEARAADRCRHFRVESRDTAIFVKVPCRPDGFSAAEVEVYELARKGLLCLTGVAPACLGVDRSTGTVVLPLLPARPLAAEVASSGGEIRPTVAAGLGRALRQVHDGAVGTHAAPVLPVVRPWPFALARGVQGLPPSVPVTPWAQTVVAAAGRVEVQRTLIGLRDAWVADTLIHGDVRSSNVLLPTPSPDRAVDAPSHGVWLVDWECSGLGDPTWDVGGALQDWIHVVLTAAARSPWKGCGARQAAVAAAGLRPAYEAFWAAYGVDAASPPAAQVAAMAGARLLQTCLESDGRGSVPALLLQLAVNILAAPGDAAREVFAL